MALAVPKLKQRGFYVDIDAARGLFEPTGVPDRESLIDVIGHVHQIGWQLRLGEHIEAKQQAEEAQGIPPTTEVEIEEMREMFSGVPDLASDEEFYDSIRRGREGRKLNNDGYRLQLPEPGSDPFENLGKPGYEAETRELRRLVEELDRRESQ